MFNFMSDIFTSNSRLQEIDKAHTAIRNQFPKSLSIREHFAIGHSWGKDKINNTNLDTIVEFMRKYATEYSDVKFMKFGVFNRTECSYMYKRANFLDEVKDLIDKPMTLSGLKTLSIIAAKYSPQVLYPIKTYLISQGMDNEFWDGILPNTKPVQKAIKLLFNKQFDSYSATLLCRDIACEMDDVSPLNINSALWVIGQEL